MLLIASGLVTTTYHAQDLSTPWKTEFPSYEDILPNTIEKNDAPPTNNSDQNKQATDARKEIERKLGKKLTNDEKREFHDHISGQDYDYHDLVEEGYWLFHGR